MNHLINKFKQRCVTIFLFLFNLYNDMTQSLHAVVMVLIYRLCALIHHVNSGPIIHATANNIDVTTTIRFYYYIDNTLSVASMQRWLANCGIKASTVLIIFKKNTNDILTSYIDLDNDNELLTDAPFVDTTLSLLPAKNIKLM